MIGALISGVVSLGAQWLGNRQKVAEAKAERAIERIKQDGPIAENLTKGIKDELVLITVFSPVWVSMAGAVIDSDVMIDRAQRMTEVMQNYAPAEVWAGLLVMTAVVSLGGRVTDVLDRFGWRKAK